MPRLNFPVQLTGSNLTEAQAIPITSNLGFGDDPRGLVPISQPTLLDIPTYDGSGQTVHPSPVYFPRKWNGYHYWMAHTPYPGGDVSKENPSIVVSNDGINWINPPGITNPIFGPPALGNYSDPHLEYDYSINKLVLYWQHNGQNKHYRSESSNGVTWSAEVEVTGIGTSPSLIRTWTTGTSWIGIMAALNGIYRCQSLDGVAFDRPARVSTGPIGQVGHSWFGIDDIGWHGLLTVSSPARLWSDCQLYYAFSPNGWDWTVFPMPILGRNQGMPEGYNIYRAGMVNLGDRMRIYYSVMAPGITDVRIGYMDAKIGFTNTRRYNGTITIPLFRNLEIRNTSAVVSSTDTISMQEWNNYTNKSIVYTNTHDVALKLHLLSNFRGSLTLTINTDNLRRFNGGTPAFAVTSLPVGTANDPVCITADDFPPLKQRLPGEILFSAQRLDGVAPTTGALNLSLLMWND